MASGSRILSEVKIDSYVPQAVLCAHCKVEVDLTTARYGRAMMGFKTYQKHDVVHTLNNGRVHAIPTVDEKWYPVKKHGYFCFDCYTLLWNITWRDKTGHLKHAFESCPVPGEIIQPKNDDYEASKVTKGLYAPHVVKGRRRNDDYFEDPQLERNASSPVIDNPPSENRKLQGFNRSKRDDIKLKPRKTIVRNGKWKVNPNDYNYNGGGK